MTDKCRHQQKHLRLSASICFNLRLKINYLKFIEVKTDNRGKIRRIAIRIVKICTKRL